ncbi:SAV_2336 N-terminal domain-related protein [Streptomyces cacaoi]
MSPPPEPPQRPPGVPPPSPTGRAADRPIALVAELVARLRSAGPEPTSEEVAEALWLARWTAPAAPPEAEADAEAPGDGSLAAHPETATGPAAGRPADGASGPDPRPEPADATGRDDGDGRDGRDGGNSENGGDGAAPVPPASTEPSRAPSVELYPARRSGGAPRTGIPVRAPAARALPGLALLHRALRPLQRYRPPLPPAAGELDEEATAELSARAAVVHPVFARVTRRRGELQLLMDASPTAAVWQPTAEQLRLACEQLGVFRDVRLRHLSRAADGTPLLAGRTGPGAAGSARPADRHLDPTGRRLTLVLSDCVGPLWQDGGAQRMLHRWARRTPVAVVQPLPPRLWPRTALPAEPGTLLREGSGRFGFLPEGFGPPAEPDALPVPVLLPTPQALGNWARLLSGGAGGGVPGGVPGPAAWVRPRHPAVPPPAPGAPGAPGASGPHALLRAFHAGASPGARDLARHLAVVPLVPPVMHLVQEAMLPDTGPMELAEVLLSGLLERYADPDEDGPRYAFVPGVRELLLQSLDRSAAVLVLKHLSAHVSRHFGRGTRNFAAVAVARLTGRGSGPVAPDGAFGEADGPGAGQAADDELFAQVPAEVVRFYLPDAEAADHAEEAERLLHQWEAERDVQLLHRARAAAETACAADAGARPRRTLARILRALARVPGAHRGADPAAASAGAAALLREAAALLTGPDPHALLERAAVEYELWRTTDSPAPLLAAERTLRALGSDEGTGEPEEARTPPAAAGVGERRADAGGREDRSAGGDGGDRADGGDGGDGDGGEAGQGAGARPLGAGRNLPPHLEQVRRLRLGRVLLALARAAPEHRRRAAPEAVRELREASDMPPERAAWAPQPADTSATPVRPDTPDGSAAPDRPGPLGGPGTGAIDEPFAPAPPGPGAQRCATLLDLADALRLTGAPAAERLRVLDDAAAAAPSDGPADERAGLRLRCTWARAGVLREAGSWEEAAEAYAAAVRSAPAYSAERGELLVEWGEMLLGVTGRRGEAENLLREALTSAPTGGPSVTRASRLLGDALLARYRTEGFLPDLYEGCHLLESAARQEPGPARRAEVWLDLGRARALFPPESTQRGMAERELTTALHEAGEAGGEADPTAARAWHALGEEHLGRGRRERALAAYREAAEAWRRVGERLVDVPWEEVRRTRERIEELARGGAD